MPSENTRTDAGILPVARRSVAAHDVVVQHGLDVPALLPAPFLRSACCRQGPALRPATVRKMMVAGNLCLLSTRAHSMLTAVPLPSSLAPGAASGRRWFRCCANRSGRSPARCARRSRIGAVQNRINIGDFGRLGNSRPGSSTNSSVFTSRQPPHSLEYCSNSLLIHSAAALPCPCQLTPDLATKVSAACKS